MSSLLSHLCSRQYITALLSHLNITAKRTSSFILGIYLWKLKNAHTDEMISHLFKIPRSTIEKYYNQVCIDLLNNFVPLYLGLSNTTRETFKENQTFLAKRLFLSKNPEGLITIWDGTYIYIQKSSNYTFQKKSYSMHKNRNLMKPMMVVTSNGYICDTLGPYPANMSDAEILNTLMQNNNFSSIFRPKDVFIVDRGFRNAVSTIEEKGFNVHMSSYIDKNKKQLTTEQANSTRLITKVRFIIEVINGKIKKLFRYFDIVWNNNSLLHMSDDFRIACMKV